MITEANGTSVTTTDALTQQVKAVAKDGYLRLYIYRPQSDRYFYAVLKLSR